MSTTEQSVDHMERDARWIHRLARGLLRDRDLAADVAQETLAVDLSAKDEPEPVARRSWLAGVARRLARNAIRREQQRADRDRVVARTDASDAEQRTQERLRAHADLTSAVRSLPETYRTVVALRFFEQRSPRSIGRELGLSAGAVRQRIHRGLTMLREQLDGDYGERDGWVSAFVALGFDRVPTARWLPRVSPPVVLAAILLVAGAAVVMGIWRAADAAGRTDTPTVPAPAPGPDPLPEHLLTVNPTGRGDEELGVRRALQDPATLREQVDRYLGTMSQMGLYSGSVLIARGDDVIVRRSFGRADHDAGIDNTPGTAFKLMSTSKSFTAVAVMRLVQARALKLADPVAEHLPGWPEAWAKVSVHDLLDHSSGIPNLEVTWGMHERSTSTRGLRAFGTFVEGRTLPPLEAEPGERMRYSNFNYEMAGALAEAVSGLDLPALMAREVFVPAGLTRTGFDDGSRREGLAVGYFWAADGGAEVSRQDMSTIQAAGGLWATVEDLHRFDRALAGNALLDDTTKALMHTARLPGYACGWQTTAVHGQACLHHSGGANGYVGDFLRFDEADVCIAVLSNYAHAPISRISSDLAAIAFGVPLSLPVVPDEDALATAAGVYGFAGGSHRGLVLRRAGPLLLAFDRYDDGPRAGGRTLVHLGEGRWFAPWGNGELRTLGDRVELPQGALRRAASVADDWDAACGEYRCEAGTARLVRDGSRYVLEVPMHPRQVEFAPYATERAMAMVMVGLGTRVVREGDRLIWTRADGHDLRLERVR